MIDSDPLLILGLAVAALTIPTAVSAYADRRPPRLALGLLAIGAGLVAIAEASHPGGYRLGDIPVVFLNVVGRVVY